MTGELARLSDRPITIAESPSAAHETRAFERIRLYFTDRGHILLASVHILSIIARLAWRKEIARRRLLKWGHTFFGAWLPPRKLIRIARDSGFCYRARGPRRTISDQEGSSTLILLENDSPLAAQHATHDEIRVLGRGRYSHWGRHIYFSSSDNTDPRRNGRTYRLRRRK